MSKTFMTVCTAVLLAGCAEDLPSDDDPLSDPHDPYVGLVAWWPLDGDAADVSGNGYDGIIEGATPTAGRTKGRDTAMAFDGPRDAIRIPVMGEVGDEVTISLWAKFHATEPAPLLHVDNHAIVQATPRAAHEWHHIMVVYDANAVTTFVDGRQISSLPRTDTPFTAGRTWRLGDAKFRGILDDVRVYERVMSVRQMELLM